MQATLAILSGILGLMAAWQTSDWRWVIGVDIGAGVIEAAKTLAPDVDFRIGDAEELEFTDASF